MAKLSKYTKHLVLVVILLVVTGTQSSKMTQFGQNGTHIEKKWNDKGLEYVAIQISPWLPTCARYPTIKADQIGQIFYSQILRGKNCENS